MPTTRGLERLIFFSDAVAAIAITLLILPLVDAASQAGNADNTAAHFFAEEQQQIVAFLISFAVIARLWVAHHALFEHLASYSGRIVFLSLIWSFTIVVLPLPTAMSAEFNTEPLTVGFYIGTMLASSLTLTLISLAIRGDSRLEAPEHPMSRKVVRGSAMMTFLFALALAVGVLAPPVNFWALLLLLLAGPIEAIIDRRRGAQGDRQEPS